MAPRKIQIENRTGDIFEDVEPITVFIHSCNCKGSWGKGIALEFKKRYPAEYKIHHEYCSERSANQLLGTCQVLPSPSQATGNDAKDVGINHIVACLFTKDHWGPTKSASQVEQVIDATRQAMQHLLKSLADMLAGGELSHISELRMPKINAGLFNVPWERTLEILNELEVPDGKEAGQLSKIVVFSR